MWNVIILALVYCLKDMLAQRVCAKIINSGQIQVEFFQGSSFFYFFMALIRVNYLNWIWFGIFMTLTMVFSKVQTNLNLVWNLRLAKYQFFFPNQTRIGLENPTHFLGVSFPNQTGFGSEKDTEWNVASWCCVKF